MKSGKRISGQFLILISYLTIKKNPDILSLLLWTDKLSNELRNQDGAHGGQYGGAGEHRPPPAPRHDAPLPPQIQANVVLQERLWNYVVCGNSFWEKTKTEFLSVLLQIQIQIFLLADSDPKKIKN